MRRKYFTEKFNQGVNPSMKITNLVLMSRRMMLALAFVVTGGGSAALQAADIGTTYLQLPVAVQSGKPKVIGSVLARPVLLKGEVNSTVNGTNRFTALGANTFNSYTPVSTAISGWTNNWTLAPASDDHYIIEFTSGPHTGLVKRVSSFSGSDATVEGNLPTIDAGTRFVLRKDHTLASLFGDQTSATASGITAGSAAGSADQFGIFDASGKIVRFFLRSGVGWKDSLDRTGVNRNHVRVSLGTGVLLTPVTTKTIYLNGEYRGTRSKISVTTVNSFLANPYPVSVTLADSGLASYLTRGSAAGSADEIRFMESGKFVNYFVNTSSDYKPSSNRFGPSQASNTVAAGEGFAFKKVGTASTARDIAWAPQYLAQ